MNLLKTFESRVSDAFGASAQGSAAPFSFKKLAKRTAREMEAETYEIEGVDTAPALYTILVAPADDALMRPLYAQLTNEITSFVEAQAQSRGYVFVGKPLARFMVDPSLRSGRFAVFAENIDARTLQRLREEEAAFLAGSTGMGGAAASVGSSGAAAAPARANAAARAPLATPPHQAQVMAPATATPIPEQQKATEQEFAPLVDPMDEDSSVGLGVIPANFDEGIYQEQRVAVSPAAPVQSVPVTQRRPSAVPVVDAAPAASPAPQPAPKPASCQLVDQQTGHAYTAYAPETPIGRERTPHGIVLRDPNVSRHHAMLSYDNGTWRIRDLNSTNGTLVNDVDIDACALRDGDVITVGLINLEFRETPR